MMLRAQRRTDSIFKQQWSKSANAPPPVFFVSRAPGTPASLFSFSPQ
jgi:hypothetical protein